VSNERILVVDDEKKNRDFLAEILKEDNYDVDTAEDGLKAIELLKEFDFHVVLTDLRMPGADGIEVLRNIKAIDPHTAGIVFTGFGTIKTAIKAMKEGAYDYITKPFKVDEIKMVINKALEYQRLHSENILLRQQLKQKYKFNNIIGDSDEMQGVFELVEKVADSDSTILIYGESGTGKELITRAIHFNSRRRDKPLIPVNCGAIPEGLLESELFGYERGAFTGATRTRVGRFELASGGTIFLDEVGDMSPGLQVKVLRVLQEQQFERVGGIKTIKADVRVIAATHRNLEEEVKKENFREDLYYRLNVIPIDIPPLRARKSDIPLLADHFLNHFNKIKNRHIKGISPLCIKYFTNYEWPGNVRELENMIERLVILKNNGLIVPEDLPEKLLETNISASLPKMIEIPDDGLCFKTAVNEFEKELILQALEKSAWVKNKAAELLKLNRTTLVEKMKKKHLEKDSLDLEKDSLDFMA